MMSPESNKMIAFNGWLSKINQKEKRMPFFWLTT